MQTNHTKRGVRGRRHPEMEREIGQTVRRHREQAGLSVEDMAARMGLSPTQLHRMEEAKAIVTISNLAAAARVLGVPVSLFYGRHNPIKDAPPRTPWMSSPETRDLVEAYSAAPASVRETFSSLLRALARR